MLIDRRKAIIGVATFAAVGAAEGASPAQAAGQTAAQTAAQTATQTATQTDMPAERVLGFGGFFFRSHDPKQLALWYQVHLGIDQVPTDSSHHGWQQTAGSTAFSPFSMESKYLGPPQQAFMLNFRVRNLDAMVAQLRKADIEVKVDPEKYPYGRFARLHDPDGNPIELWEPAG